MKSGFMLNQDEEFVAALRECIRQNDGYCVCKLERIPENKCPCHQFMSDSDCECGLYVKDPTYIIADEISVDREASMEGYV